MFVVQSGLVFECDGCDELQFVRCGYVPAVWRQYVVCVEFGGQLCGRDGVDEYVAMCARTVPERDGSVVVCGVCGRLDSERVGSVDVCVVRERFGHAGQYGSDGVCVV